MIAQNALVMAIAGLASIAGATTPRECPKKCVDGITKCGQRWGGCYNICTEKPPRPPPCPTTAKPTPTPTPTPTDDCRTRTVCIDYINSCGMMYGTCVADCKPWPTLVPPPCPKTTLVTATAKPTY